MANRLGRFLTTNKPGVIFLHTPKTGGTSIEYAIRRHYFLSWYPVRAAPTLFAAKVLSGSLEEKVTDEQIQAARLTLLHYGAGWERKFLFGHVWYHPSMEILRSRGYLLMTCLREPVNRWISHFLWNHYKQTDHGKIEAGIDSFMSTEKARNFGSIYIRYMGGVREKRDYRSEEAIDNAVSNYHRLDIKLFLEDLDDLKSQISNRLGFNPKLGHKKNSPAPSFEARKIRESAELRKIVEDLCRPDLEFYHRVMDGT